MTAAPPRTQAARTRLNPARLQRGEKTLSYPAGTWHRMHSIACVMGTYKRCVSDDALDWRRDVSEQCSAESGSRSRARGRGAARRGRRALAGEGARHRPPTRRMSQSGEAAAKAGSRKRKLSASKLTDAASAGVVAGARVEVRMTEEGLAGSLCAAAAALDTCTIAPLAAHQPRVHAQVRRKRDRGGGAACAHRVRRDERRARRVEAATRVDRHRASHPTAAAAPAHIRE